MRHEDLILHRRRDGTIDVEFHVARAAQLRAQMVRDVLQSIWTALLRVLFGQTALPSKLTRV